MFNIEQELKKAKQYKKNGNNEAAKNIYLQILQQYPNSKKAKQGLKSVSNSKQTNNSQAQTPDLTMEKQNQLVGLYQSDKIEAAIKETSTLIGQHPNHPFLYNFLGLCFKKISQNQNAINSFVKSLELKPDYIEAYCNLGTLLKSMNKIPEAIMAFEEALKIDPSNSTVIKELGTIKDYSNDQKGVENIYQLYSTTKDLNTKVDLGYLLFKIFDEHKQYDQAFKFLENSNHIKHKSLNYDVDDHIDYILNIKKLFENSDLESIKEKDDNTLDNMIFIVGMPRSGTTLTEQILSSHSDVLALGEQNFMTSITNDILKDIERSGKVSSEHIQTIRKLYTSEIKKFNNENNCIFLTDKTPHNFIYIGFILSAFPNAKVINLSRDPIAVSWSIYKTYFPADGLRYSYDFDDIAEFYKNYIDLMEFWNQLFQNKIYTLNYESIIKEQESTTKNLLEYCNLQWDEKCLEFQNNQRAVLTASAQQVKQPIYDHSIEGWKNYKEQLEPLIEELIEKDLIDDN